MQYTCTYTCTYISISPFFQSSALSELCSLSLVFVLSISPSIPSSLSLISRFLALTSVRLRIHVPPMIHVIDVNARQCIPVEAGETKGRDMFCVYVYVPPLCDSRVGGSCPGVEILFWSPRSVWPPSGVAAFGMMTWFSSSLNKCKMSH